MDKCSTCEQLFDAYDLRPYGKGGSLICFDCAMVTPESRQEALRQMSKAIEAICSVSSGNAIRVTETGFEPLEKGRLH